MKVLRIVGIIGEDILWFDDLPRRSKVSRDSEERICCKLEGDEEAGETIPCFDNLPIRSVTSRLSGAGQMAVDDIPLSRGRVEAIILLFCNLPTRAVTSRRLGA